MFCSSKLSPLKEHQQARKTEQASLGKHYSAERRRGVFRSLAPTLGRAACMYVPNLIWRSRRRRLIIAWCPGHQVVVCCGCGSHWCPTHAYLTFFPTSKAARNTSEAARGSFGRTAQKITPFSYLLKSELPMVVEPRRLNAIYAGTVEFVMLGTRGWI